jgi:hypothetical protein
MDDYSITSLSESKNEWCARLVNIFTPAIISGLKSIFNEAWTLCKDNEEDDKYLMTFQTFLSRVPKWNSTIIETERKRICEVSGCGYLEELITCVHIIQLKALSCVRVGQKQKKIDVNIPSVDEFVHKVYINVARKLYTNIYLFEKNIAPLQIQKHNRELEIIIKECVLNTVRDTMPVETLLRAYMDESQEQDVEIKEEEIVKTVEPPPEEVAQSGVAQSEVAQSGVAQSEVAQAEVTPTEVSSASTELAPKQETFSNENISLNIKTPVSIVDGTERVGFTNIDNAISTTGVESTIDAPKTIERLEQIANESAERRKLEEEDDEEDKLSIGTEIKLDTMDINDLSKPFSLNENPPILDNIEIIV